MECVEARALKSSFLSELPMKSSPQQGFFDDLMYVNGINGAPCDDFSIDVFLDLSNEDFKDGFVEEEEEESEEEKSSLSVSSQDRVEDDSSNSTSFSGNGDSGSFPAGGLPVPVDDIEDLEWLSQFTDDSVPELSLLCPADNYEENKATSFANRYEPVSRPAVQRTPIMRFPAPIPAKARTKRSRPSGRAWSRGSPALSESSSTPVSSCGSSPTSVLIFSSPVRSMELIDGVVKPLAKKQKKKPAAARTSEETGGSQTQRRCTHCQVQKTPQWRTGPLGPKTLCNACGVRYKSGRLYPEYRPACSPTFSSEVHSNSHRKVLEMRRKKEMTGVDSVFASAVPSF